MRGTTVKGDRSFVRISRLSGALLAVVILVAACGGETAEDPSNDICSELNELDAAIDAIDGDSSEEFQQTFAAAREEYDEFSDAARAQYPDEVADLEEAMDEFQRELTTNEEDEGLLGGILDLVAAAAELAAASDRLDDLIDC